MRDRIPPRHPFRDAIASLSTGSPNGPTRSPYYGQVAEWFRAAYCVAESLGFQLSSPSYLESETDYLHVYRGDDAEPLARIRLSIHRMESGRREILSYVC